MSIDSASLLADPRFFFSFRHGTRVLLAIYDENPALGGLFSSQQRWLMSHAAFALACSHDPDDPASGLYAARFISVVQEHAVASKNTAADFIQELLGHGFIHVAPGQEDRRRKPLMPSDLPEQAMSQWLELHLGCLDSFDGGRRAETYGADPSLLYRLQPRITRRILTDKEVRYQGPTFNLFTWANFGGLLMDLLIGAVDPGEDGAGLQAERIAAGTLSINEVARRFSISRTHVMRLFNKAAEAGDIGWSGRRGESAVWISHRLLQDYSRYQAAKHALVDVAFEEVAGG
jgi:AraC-like DNA-binding protein